MITPDILAKSGSEHGLQAALFSWAAVAQLHGFIVAWDWAITGVDLRRLGNRPVKPVPELRWLHAIPNGGSRGDTDQSRKIRGATLKAEGVRDGVPDIFLPVPLYPYHGLYIEMKTPTGAVRPSQKEFGDFAVSRGYAFTVERSWRSAARILQEYLLNAGTSLDLKRK